MKNLLAVFSLAFVVIFAESCQEDTLYMDTGTITSFDARRCVHPCCGGYFIEINDETYRFLELPEGSKFELSYLTTLPLSVKINWHLMEDACAGDEIILDAIK